MFRYLSAGDKIRVLLLYFIRANFVIAMLSSALQQRWTILFVSTVALLLTFLPKLYQDTYKIDIPIELEIISLLFLYGAIFLGEIERYYDKFWWWDIFLHTGSGVALGFIGFIMMYVLDKGRRIQTSPFLMATFSFSFALSMGAIWEIFEFCMDQWLGLHMQRNSLIDTMGDIIVDALGAFFTATLGYFYIKGTKFHFFSRIVDRFVEENPHLFGYKPK